ncbi:MAG TPA: hypothetical protein VFX92_03440, partial [Candidatus Krumholzibacteria bacterium]|nr:hypothetical protein [Candidatus Krumholzibacteria bacterium]
MKRVLLAALLAAQVMASVGVAFAQREEPKYLKVPHRFQIFLEGGGALPYRPGEWHEYWNTSFAFGIGAGTSIFPWLEINGGFSHMSWANNAIKSKSAVKYTGIKELEGGSISTNIFYGSAKFIAVPSARTNPYLEMAVGYFKTSAEDLVIEDVLTNQMDPVSGLSIAPSVGIQYALGDYWTAYARYSYIVNANSDFKPGDLLQPVSGERPVEGSNQKIETISVGLI